jgi:hypothetical protein
LVPTFLHTYPRFATTQQVLDLLFKRWVAHIQAQGSSTSWMGLGSALHLSEIFITKKDFRKLWLSPLVWTEKNLVKGTKIITNRWERFEVWLYLLFSSGFQILLPGVQVCRLLARFLNNEEEDMEGPQSPTIYIWQGKQCWVLTQGLTLARQVLICLYIWLLCTCSCEKWSVD